MKTIPLAVAGAFHTAIMEPAIGALAKVLREAEMRSPRIPVVSNVDARPHDNVDELRELLEQQVSAAVQWEATMRYLLDQNVEHFCEVGPGRVLRGLLKRVHRKADSHGTLD
jgi:[acyl-carrier-protein] S-malonyltransferase